MCKCHKCTRCILGHKNPYGGWGHLNTRVGCIGGPRVSQATLQLEVLKRVLEEQKDLKASPMAKQYGNESSKKH